jgi:type IV pilus assembly protein PilC
VPLSYRAKQSFYHHLAQLLRSGVSFPSALDKLALTFRGPLRRTIEQLRKQLTAGSTISEAFTGSRPAVSALEASVVGAADRSGRLEHGLKQLSDSFGALAQARSTVITKSLYPLFVLHFGIFAMALPVLFTEGLEPYLRATGPTLLVVYGIFAALALLGPALRDAGSTSATADRLLRRVPLIGKVRRAFALARFCLVYDLQLGSGVNVMDALSTAGKASRSGMIFQATERALPEVRSGAQVGPLLASSGAFPEEMMRGFLVAEETGELDQELTRMAAEYQGEALRRLEIAAEWISKMIYVAVVLYVAWVIISGYQKALQPVLQMLGE